MIMRLLPFVLVAGFWQAAEPDTDALLLDAIRAGNGDRVVALLDEGADPNALDSDHTPALLLATLFTDADTVEALLARGAAPNRPAPGGGTALMWAIPDFEKVRRLVHHGADVNLPSSDLGRTPLLVAAAYPGTARVLELLVAHGADIEAADANGATALALATRSADLEVVRFLVENGIDPNAVQGVRLSRPHMPTIEYLMSMGLRIAPDTLVGGTHWQEPQLVARWIGQGADVNASGGSYRKTPLMNAAASETAGVESLALLLDRGADPNAETTEGERALDWALYRGATDKIALLERHGARRGNGPRSEALPEPAGIEDPRESVRRSVDLLLAAAPPMFDNRGCVTCHNNTLPAMAAAVARRKGIEVPEAAVRENLDDILAYFRPGSAGLMQGHQGIGGIALTLGYVAMALAEEGHAPDRMTAALTHWSAATQMGDGSWTTNGANRPPMEYSPISHTAMASRVLSLYPIPGREAGIARRLNAARDWLVTSEARLAEERSMRLMGLVWTGAPPAAIEGAMDDILAAQRADGGWSQLPTLGSDAYATGMALYALHEAGLSITTEAYRRGVAFLLETQYADGSWLVRTRAFPGQEYFESGFPFGRHQWISAAGTGWAALAIAFTLSDAPPSEPRGQAVPGTARRVHGR